MPSRSLLRPQAQRPKPARPARTARPGVGPTAIWLGLVLAGAACSAAAQSDVAQQTLRLRSLAATCAACHGTDGAALASEPMTRLAGLPREQIVAQLQAFRDGSRPATVMHQLVKGYG
ncbi:MAG: cytochrome c, partial [Leptothrix sp. (in: b-proteobacteria)]